MNGYGIKTKLEAHKPVNNLFFSAYYKWMDPIHFPEFKICPDYHALFKC